MDSSSVHVPASWFIRPDGRDASRTIHGVSHAIRVWTHAMALADAVGIEPWQREALDLACRWHDIGRVHDGADYYHGALSAGKVVGLRLHEGVDSPVLAVALACVTHHSGEEHIHAREAFGWLPDSEQSWAVFRILKDADALDRVRLGSHDLDPSFLRFDASHERIQVAWELLGEIPCGWLPGDVSGG